MTQEAPSKIDGILLKYAFSNRRYMLDLQNKGIRAEYFNGIAGEVFGLLQESFAQFGDVLTNASFLEYTEKQNEKLVSTVEGLFAKFSTFETPDSDFNYHLNCLRDRYTLKIANMHIEQIQTAVADTKISADAVNDLYKKAWNDIAALNRTEVFDEGSLGQDMSNMKAEYEAVAKNPLGFRGVMSGYSTLDNITNGFQPSELIVVCGMEGTGKSVLMMNMGINAWLGTNAPGQEYEPTGKNVLYFTLEMPRSNRGKFSTGGYLNRRVLSAVTGLSFSDMRKAALDEKDKKSLMAAMDWISEYDKKHKFYVVDIPRGATVEDIEIKFQELRERFPIDLVIVDYMGIMASSHGKGGGDDSDWQAQGQIASGLHEFARSYAVPVVTGAQVTRPQGKNNSLKDQNYNTTRVARSAQITQNANIVMQIGCRDDEENYTDMPLHITKMRDGNKGKLSFNKAFHCMRIYDGAPPSDVSLNVFEDAPGLPAAAKPDMMGSQFGQFDITTTGNPDFGPPPVDNATDDEMDW